MLKLRFRDDSVRIRLTRSEVSALDQGRAIEAATHFGPGSVLRYRIAAGADAVQASFENGLISIAIPQERVSAWAAAPELAISADQAVGASTLRIMIEKDLECAKPRPGEDNSDAFPASLGRAHCA